MIRTLFFATAALTIGAGAAIAAEKTVTLDRERLGDPAYVEALYAEIETTARAVCKTELRGSPLYHSGMDYCVARSIEDAVEQVDHPTLTAYAEGAPEIGPVAGQMKSSVKKLPFARVARASFFSFVARAIAAMASGGGDTYFDGTPSTRWICQSRGATVSGRSTLAPSG